MNENSNIKLYSSIWNAAMIRYCTDGSANYVAEFQKEYQLKSPNFIVGDLDSINQKTKDHFIKDSILIHAPDQDFTDFSKTLNEISCNKSFSNVKKIIIIGGLCGRFDHVFASINSIVTFQNEHRNKLKEIYLIDENNMIVITSVYQTTININDGMKSLTGKCGYIPITQKKTIVTTKGYKWDLENTEIFFGGIVSTSNEIDKTTLSIQSNEPTILYFEIKKEY
uniref:Thiamine diphosphokinase n=1 Tax=Parastrongyloides trichosuri TaxID=131310 RepID=A0A0N4ZUT0_PARTI